MDLGQLSQMTTWLDEEQRRGKTDLARLQQQVERLETELSDQTHLLRSLEERVAGIQSHQLTRSSLDTTLKELREEISHALAQSEERRQQERREVEQVRVIERDNVSRALNELRVEQKRLPRLEEEAGLRKAELSRLGDSLLAVRQEVTTLSQEVEKKLRSIPFLEDGRQQDTKRIAQLQQESLEALKRLEQQSSRVQMLEDGMQRQERDVGELKSLVSQIRTSQREFTEKQLLEAERVKREVADWVERLEVNAKKMDQFTAQMQEFSEVFREDRQVIENIERFQEMIKREQNQVAELQRLAEERQKRQLETWQEENEKRWRKELLRWDHQWGEQTKRNQQVDEKFRNDHARLAQHRAELDAAWKLAESQIAYRNQELRRWTAEMTRLLEERPKKD
jgi:chromosome segregation ATPase